jgi:hypothetical protein
VKSAVWFGGFGRSAQIAECHNCRSGPSVSQPSCSVTTPLRQEHRVWLSDHLRRVVDVRSRIGSWIHHPSFLVRLATQLTWTAVVFGLISAVTTATGHGVNWSLAVLLLVISVFYAWARGHPPRPGAPPNAWLLRLSPRLYRYLDGFRTKSEADGG